MTPQFSSPHRFNFSHDRTLPQRIQPIAAIALVFGLAVAILTEGQIPVAWTKTLLGMLIAPTVVTALWLTGPRDERHPADNPDRRPA